jgi:hypothetical protein
MPNNTTITFDHKIWDTYEDVYEWWKDGSAVLGANISGYCAFTSFALGLTAGIILSPVLVVSLPVGLGLDLLKNASSKEEDRTKYHKLAVNIGLAPLTPSALIINLSSEVLKKITEAFSLKQDNTNNNSAKDVLPSIAGTETDTKTTISTDPKYQALNKVTNPNFKITEFWDDFIEVDNWYRNNYHLLGLSIVNFIAPPGLALGLAATIVCSPLLLISMPAGLARYGYDSALTNQKTATKNALNIALSPMNYSAIIFRVTNLLCQKIMSSFTIPESEGPIEGAHRQISDLTIKTKEKIDLAVTDGVKTISEATSRIISYPAKMLSTNTSSETSVKNDKDNIKPKASPY